MRAKTSPIRALILRTLSAPRSPRRQMASFTSCRFSNLPTFTGSVRTGSENQIIGLGGGTPCYANNHELLKGEGITSIYLKASVETLFNRLSHNKSKRPIVANKSEAELQEFIAKHLFDRSYYYNQAEYKVAVDGKSIDETVNDIMSILA